MVLAPLFFVEFDGIAREFGLQQGLKSTQGRFIIGDVVVTRLGFAQCST